MKKMLFVLLAVSPVMPLPLQVYHGQPWSKHMQSIPGKIECEFYDRGGEGVAYHDSDSINNGSGKLNPITGDPLNEFRMKEGVDISYTKAHAIDNNPYNKAEPVLNQLYVGWTQPGEWLNYTVIIKEEGKYNAGLMYTANGDGTIAIEIDGRSVAAAIKIPSTYDDRDTVAWRQWHHWNRIDSLTSIPFKKGVHTLTLHIVEHGNMNFDWLAFTKE